jgi:3-hydroxy-3-methylglutaryl CoA synthase
VAGDDEDAITLAVEAGRAALIAGGGMSEACERIISAECAGQACEVGA